MIHVTAHAAARFVERVNPSLTLDQARDSIRSHSAIIEAAAAFHCRTVVVAKRIRLVLDGTIVITVLDHHPAHNPDPVKVIARNIQRQRRVRGREWAA